MADSIPAQTQPRASEEMTAPFLSEPETIELRERTEHGDSYHDRHLSDDTFVSRDDVGNDVESLKSDAQASKHTIKSKSRLRKPSFIFPWFLESAGLLLAWASFLCMIGILMSEAGKPLHHWRLKWSINAILSVLSTVCSMSITFAVTSAMSQRKWNWIKTRRQPLRSFQRYDQASRGPWGNLQLLFHLRFTHWATVGCLAYLIILGLQPSIQAVVDYEEDYRVHDDAMTKMAFILSTKKVDRGRLAPPNPDTGEACIAYPDFGMSSAVYSGFAGSYNPIQNRAPFNCPTGNCTFVDFTSLAVCSKCHKVDHLVKKDPPQTAPLPSSVPSYATKTSATPEPTAAVFQTTFRLPVLALTNPNGIFSKTTSYFSQMGSFMAINATAYPNQTIMFKDSDTLLLSVSSLRVSKAYLDNTTKWEDSSPVANECALYFCVNEYQTKVVQNVLYETIKTNWIRKSPNSWKVIGKLDDGKNASGYPYEIGSNNLHYPLDTYIRSDLMLEGRPGSKASFNVSQSTIMSTINFLASFAINERPANYEQPPPPSTYPIKQNTDYYPSSMFIQTLWESADIDKSFANAAHSLTTWMRAVSGGREKVKEVQQYKVYVKVIWPFIIPPALGIILGTVFVFWVMWETNRLKVEVFKDSALATLAYGLDDEARSALREAAKKTDGDLTKASYDLQVMLEGDRGEVEIKAL